jgi:histidine triad (HIT) family protein
MGDCVFCKIVKGEIESKKIFESENFIAFKDANPRTEGHSLVVPKKHYETLLDVPSILFGEFLSVVQDVAMKQIKETKAEGFNLIMNNFKVAGQIVPHVHMHILPRKESDGFEISV